MSTPQVLRGVALVGALAAMAAAGYWWGQRQGTGAHDAPAPATAPAAIGTAASNTAAAEAPAVTAKPARKLLYYRNPMGLPDTSPTPKKDPMGMDYIAVYEDDAPASGGSDIKISPDRVQKLGVRTELVHRHRLDRSVRAAGRVEVDERRVFAIAPKFEGWVEKLHVNSTGQPVAAGQPLFEVYSPELVSAQREYAVAINGVAALKDAPDSQASMKTLAESSLTRLRNWDISDADLRALAAGSDARRTLTFRSPVNGIVLEKKALQGMRFMPGEMMYQIADLSRIWVLADVFEQDIAMVRNGSRAEVSINAYPERKFEGRVTFVYPTLSAPTRTVPVRIELANPGGLLKPAMFADVIIAVEGNGPKLAVPNSAVIDSGTRRVVLVQTGEGRFESRVIKLGARGQEYVEVLDGVREGENVVVSANFLIDSESNLKAALSGLNTTPATAKVSHRATGTVQEIDAAANVLSIAHGPIASLKWPSMTMEFAVSHNTLLKGLQAGAAITFEFVERQPGEWVIVSLERGKSASVKADAKKP